MNHINLNDTAARELFDGYHVKFIHSERMTLAFLDIEAGKPFPEHSHPHEQITNILEGEFEMTIGGETRILRAGESAIIPPSVVHSGRTITRCRVIDAFSPPREDYIAKFSN
jgi:quercetin dioxygenase-like cupin family protein